ncbi:protease inhibitor I42 family protein [Roseovarius salinarum]|uniref:protease inhibitor I42 family protein n=1 Tax=Roseovarius salinarum TaxID=1981892 RepID=UPI000C33BB76|nr:protease inhibitor I42 family protein [Roseovarius salinarum]
MRQASLFKITLILLAASAVIGAQARPAHAGWLALYESAVERAQTVAVAQVLPRPEGGAVAFGSVEGGADGPASDPTPRADLAFVRWTLDKRGGVQTQHAYHAQDPGALREARATPDGGQILVGDFFTPAAGAGGGPSVVAPDAVSGSWIVKLDATGEVTWGRRFDDTRPDGTRAGRHYRLSSIARTRDGGVIAVGETHARATDARPGDVPDMDMWLVRLDAAGDLLWQRRIGGDQIDAGMTIRRVPAGGFIAAGLTSGRGAFATGGALWLVRLDNAGRILWQKSYGGPAGPAAHGVDAGWRIAPVDDGGYVVAGSTRSFGQGGGARGDVWVMRLGPRGDVRWQNAYGGERLDTAPSLAVREDGILVAAQTSSFMSPQPPRPDAKWDWDTWFLQLDRDGMIGRQTRLGRARPGTDGPSDLSAVPGGYLAAGLSAPGVATEGAAPQVASGWLARLDADGSIGPVPGGSPFHLVGTDAQRRATSATPRRTELGAGPAAARMTPWQPDRPESRITVIRRYAVAPEAAAANRTDGAGPPRDGCVPPGPVTESYVARIGRQDLYNSEGARLKEPWQVLRQDRANYHRFGLRDPRDEGDRYFDTAASRERIERMYEAGGVTGGISAEVAQALVQGGATVEVDIHDCGQFLDIRLLSKDDADGERPRGAVAFSCKQHACLHGRMTGAVTAPPSDKCWGWHPSHSYNLLTRFDVPLTAARVEARVTGGPSELDAMRDGFRLEALPASQLSRGARRTLRRGPGCAVLDRARGWRTLRSFAAPVTSGDRITIRWQGDLPRAVALRLRAPGGLYVDDSALTVTAAAPDGEGAEERTLTEADDGRTVRVAAGDTLRLRLPASPSTGHSWAVTRINPEVLRLDDRSYRQDPDCDGKLGCGGHTTFTFTAVGAGRTGLGLAYARQWRDAPEPRRRFDVTVVVADGT